MSHNTFDRLDQITAPTLLLVGAEDIFTPRKFADEMAEHIPNASVEIIDGAAHAAYWEQPDALNEKLLEHLVVTTSPEAEPAPA